MKKFFVFLSHPIHYHIAIYKLLAKNKDIDLTVYFYSDFGLGKHFDPQFKKKIDFQKEDILEGYKYVILKNLNKPKKFKFFDFINLEIFKIIFKEKPDYALINYWSYFSDWFVIFSSIFSETKLCLRSENPLSHEFKKPKWKILIKKIILGFLFKKVKLFFYIGEENKKFLRFYGADEYKMFFTPYAVDNNYFQKQKENLFSQRNKLREDLGINKDDVVILFVGKLINKKRPFDLLFAYEKLYNQENIKNVVLIYVGDGELKNEMEKFIKDKNLKKVMLVGFKNQKELPIYYTISDIFVLPSGIGETWGLVVNEAMNFGLPVIVSDLVGSSTDLVKNDENGYIYPCGDIDKLSNHLKDLVLDPEKRKNFGENSVKIIKEYSYQKSVESILKAIT
jgi:glycosyltransferase involved in cell wall biosynthesis